MTLLVNYECISVFWKPLFTYYEYSFTFSGPLTENMRYKIRDTSHLLDIIDTINETGIPDETILVSFDIVNMFPSIDNVKGMDAVRLALYTRDSNKPSTECVLEGLEICLYNNNSIFEFYISIEYADW